VHPKCGQDEPDDTHTHTHTHMHISYYRYSSIMTYNYVKLVPFHLFSARLAHFTVVLRWYIISHTHTHTHTARATEGKAGWTRRQHTRMGICARRRQYTKEYATETMHKTQHTCACVKICIQTRVHTRTHTHIDIYANIHSH